MIQIKVEYEGQYLAGRYTFNDYPGQGWRYGAYSDYPGANYIVKIYIENI